MLFLEIFKQLKGKEINTPRKNILFKLIIPAFLGLLPFLCQAQSEKPDIHFHQLPVQELSSPNVNGIYQDQTGFMWFSTNDGLNKYDGKGISIHHPFLGDSVERRAYIMRDLHEDENGIFWISTWHGFSRFDPATGDFKVYYDTEEASEKHWPRMTLSVFEDSKNRIWIGTHLHGLHQFDSKADRFVKQYPYLPRDKNEAYSLSHKKVIKIWEGEDGMIWTLTGDFQLNRLDPKTEKIEKFNYPPFLEDHSEKNTIRLSKADQFGNIWIGDKEHLYFWKPLKGTYETFTYPENFTKTSNPEISHIHKDRTGIIWIATSGDGLKRWDTERGTFYSYNYIPNDSRSLPSDVFNNIYEDRNGLIWLSTQTKGILYFDPKPSWFKQYKYNSRATSGISGNRIYAITGSRKNKIWIAEQSFKGLNLFDPLNETFTQYPPINSIKGNDISAIYESPNEPDVLWVGYHNAGLDRWEIKTGKQENFRYDMNDSTSLSSNEVLSIYEDRKGVLWFTSQWGLTSLDQSTMTFTKYLTDKNDSTSISHNSITSVFEDRDGRFWVGTIFGLNELDRSTGKFRRYFHDPSKPNTISNSKVQSILEDSRGMLWIGCQNGLNLMDRKKGTFTRFSNLINLPSDQHWKQRDAIRLIIEDNYGRLWIGNARGLSVLSEINEAGFNSRHIDMLGGDFIGGINRQCKYKSENGDLNFGNSNGLFIIFPDKLKKDTIDSNVLFTGFKIANEPVRVTSDGSGPLTRSINATAQFELSYKDDIITFEFSMLDYEKPQLHQYAYRLEGFKEGWINIGNHREVTFINLDAGEYTLHVKAADENGTWNTQQAKISFTIVPAWWQTQLFKWEGFLLLFALLLALFYWRNRSIKKQNVRLQEKVKDRTKDLSNALEYLKTAQAELVQSEKMALLGSLIASVAHEVNNPLGAIGASNSNLVQSIIFLRKHFPKIFQILPPKRQALYQKLIDRIPIQNLHLVGKERRAMKKQLTEQFENAELPNPDLIADTLLEIGVTVDIKPFYSLFKEEEQELILDTLYHSSQVQNNSQNIKNAADRAGKIVYALRSYSHNYESDTRLTVSVAETIDNVLILFNNTIKKGIEVNKSYKEISLILANPDELQQVWTNIIQNAFQAMEFKGHLDINIDQESSTQVGSLSFKQPQQFVVVSITDDGPGIPETIRATLFEALVTTKAPGEGSGLGLHICQRIIRDHKGEITFQSQAGKTIFKVWLPVENQIN